MKYRGKKTDFAVLSNLSNLLKDLKMSFERSCTLHHPIHYSVEWIELRGCVPNHLHVDVSMRIKTKQTCSVLFKHPKRGQKLSEEQWTLHSGDIAEVA